MSKKSKKNEKPIGALKPQPWIKMSTGVILIVILSILMTVLTALQTVPALGWVEGMLWGLGFGLAILAIFFIPLLYRRLFRR